MVLAFISCNSKTEAAVTKFNLKRISESPTIAQIFVEAKSRSMSCLMAMMNECTMSAPATQGVSLPRHGLFVSPLLVLEQSDKRQFYQRPGESHPGDDPDRDSEASSRSIWSKHQIHHLCRYHSGSGGQRFFLHTCCKWSGDRIIDGSLPGGCLKRGGVVGFLCEGPTNRYAYCSYLALPQCY